MLKSYINDQVNGWVQFAYGNLTELAGIVIDCIKTENSGGNIRGKIGLAFNANSD